MPMKATRAVRLAAWTLAVLGGCSDTDSDRDPLPDAGEPDAGCTPATCAAQGKNCGELSDGCGDTLDCGPCTGADTCGGSGVANVCGSAPPGCGDDSCALEETCANCAADCCAGHAFYVAPPPTGSDENPGSEEAPWATLAKAASTLVAGDTVYLRAGTYNELLEPQSSGTEDAYITYAGYPGETAIIDGTGIERSWSGLVHIVGQSYLKVTGLQVQASQYFCVYVGHSAHHVLIDGNVIRDCQSSGIQLFNGWEEPRMSNIVVALNDISEVNANLDQEALTISGVQAFDVRGNHVHHGDKEGIDAKNGCIDGTIRGNLVHDISLGIYIDSSADNHVNLEVSGNVVHDCGEGISFATEGGGTLTDIAIVNNLSYRNGNGIGAHSFLDVPGSHLKTNVTVVNNTFAYNTGLGIQIVEEPQVFVGFVIRNNLISDSEGLINFATMTEADLTMDHNFLGAGYTEIHGTDYLEGDPLFVDPDAQDFHLQAGSPAIDQGASTGAPATDLDGVTRPQGAAVDMGCYERGQ
jgi:hypothetical protein